MPGENDKIKKLYDTFVSDGYDMESEEDFRKNLSDSTKRKAAYDALVNDGYDMEPFEDFEKNIGFGNKIEYLLKEPVFERDSSKVYSQIAQQHVLQANSAIKQTEEQIDKQAPVSTPANVSVNGKLRQAVKERDEISSMLAARGEELRKEYEDKSIFQKILTGIQHAEGGYHDNALETTKDDKYMKLSAALRQKNEQIAELENQKAREQGDSGFWRSFGKTVADPYTWLQAPKIADAVAMAGAKSGASEEDDILLQSTFENQQTQAEYAGNADFWERAGMMTGHMPAFMIDFMATGGGFKGMNALSKLGTKLATKAVGKEVAEQVAKDGILSYIKNNGVKGLGRFATDWTIKALGTTADDLLIRAPLMTNTVQAASTASDIIERKLGNVEQNEDGTYSFGNDKGLGDAIWQGEANAIIENYSEMFGAHLDPVLSLKNVAKLADVIGAKKIGKVLAKASASELGGIMGKTNELFNQMGVSDYFGEVSEEYYGQLWRTMLNLDDAYQQNADGTRTNLFNTGQFHGDILGGMALSMGMMGAGKTSVTAINYASMKHGVNKADARASEILGKDTWEQMKETIDLTTNEEIGDIAVGIVNDKDLSNEGKAAALDYLERSMKFRGFNLATVAQKRSEKVDEASEELNESYMDGYNAVEQQEMNDAKNMYDYQRERMKEELGVNDGALDDDVVDWMNELKNAIDSGTELGRKRAEVILDFLNAKAVKDGMMQRVRDDIDSRVGQSNAIINSRVNKSTGMIQGATMKNNDRKVYVVAGNVKQYDDKSGVDNNASDKTIIIKDAETGKFEQVSPESIFNVDDTIDPEQEKLTAAEAIRQQFAQEAANKIDGVVAFNPGDKYTITGDDGQAEVTVVANEQGIVDNGDGTINVTRDGKEVFPLSKDVIQQQVDEANRARVRQFDEERRVKNGESNAAMVEMNDQITFLDEGGNEVSGVVQSVGDDGVVVEVGGTDADLGKPTQFKAEDLYGRLTSISRGGNVMWQKEAEENREATEQPNKEQPPMNSASSKVPTDEQGRLVYEEAEPGIAWDALVEQTGGEEDIAAEIANDIIKEQEQALKNAEKELKKLQESKPKASGKPMSIEERIAAKKAEKVALEEAQKRIDTANQNIAKWKQIADTKALRQREAEAAEEKAAALKAEQEKAEQMEREVLNGVPDIVDDTPQAGEIKATSMFQYFTGTLSELIAQAKQSAQGLIKKVIAPISSRLKNDLNSQGLQIDDDYNHVIDNNAIRHTLKKHSGKNEEKRGQIPITDADFENIADVVEHYDGVEVVSGNTSAQRIIYHKSYQDGTVIFVEEQRVGRKELAAVTMWKKKNPNLTDANRTETTLISDLTEVSDNKDTNNSIKSSELGEKIAKAEAEVDVNPTDKQKEAGNYKKGHVQVGVFDITIEQPKGSVRSGVDANGNKWETTMQNTYGYIRGTEGVDGDHIDVFLSDDIDGWNGRRVFVVDQYNEDGSFDEHKVMLGFNETDDAEAAYFANYDNDWAKKHKTVVTGVNLEDFEKWIDSSHRKTKAFAEYKSVKSVEEQSSSTQVNRLSEIKSRIEELHKEQEAAHGQSDIFEEARIISEINDLFTEQRKLEQNNSNEETTTPTDAAYTITPAQYTTKRGKVLDMHLVKFNDELRDTVRKHTTMFAKQLKGWWDKEKQGFMMRSKEDAERLAEYATDAQLQQPVSMSDMQALNDGNVQFVEPQLSETSKPEERQEYTPVWQYSVSVDKKTGLTTLRRDDVSGPIPIGDGRFNYTANSPEEMLEIVRNPKNFNQELRDAVETILENKVKIREIVREEKAAAAKQEPKPGNNPSGNRLVTDERYEKLKKKMKLKIRGQMNMGIYPEILAIGTEMAVYHIEKGSRKFAEYATAMIADLGDAIRPYLKAFYNGARDLPEVAENGLDADMTPYDEVQKFDVANFDKTSIDALATAETITREAEVEQEAEIAQERIKKSRPARKKNEKKAVNSQQSNELGLFDGLTDNNKNSEHGLQRADAERSERVPSNGNRHEQGLSRGTETGSESEQQTGRGTDNEGERTGDAVDRTVRPRFSDSLNEQSIEGKRKKEIESNRKLANELKGVILQLNDKLGGEHEISGIVYYELANVFHCNDNISGPFQATRKELDAILKVARKNEGRNTFTSKNTHNNHSERGKDHAPTSVDARIEANIKAIELAKQLLENSEQATEKQMQTLRKFSGWGGLGKAFSEGTSYAPNPIQKKIRELLGEKAYQEAVMSANSAYYTPAYVVDTLWDIAEKMGFEGGNILEGSAGIGNILGQMPTHISERSDIHAIEIDGTSGGILSLLYPDAKVEIQGFEQTRIPNGSVDLAITNVPFVTGLRVNDTTGDKDLSKKFHNIHDFCIAKNVRKLREGGLGIFITSNGTLDNSKKLRDWIVSEGGADFVGAFRMHNKTFGGTGVTSDIVVIRKRVNGQKSAHAIDVSDVSGERMAEYDTGETRKVKGKETPVIKQLSMDYNRYFIEHPENMAGEMHFAFEKGDTFRPTSKGLYPKLDKKQEEMLAEFVRSFRAEEFGERNTEVTTDAMPGKKIGEVFVKDGKLYINSTASAQPLEVNANKVKGHTKVECFEAYTAIKEALAEVLSYQTENESDDGLKPLLDKLNKAYDDFVGTYGHFNKNTAIAFLRNDVDYANVFALEKFEETADEKGNRVQNFDKTDVFSKRVVEKEKEPTPANVKDGIIASIFKFGRVDIPYIAEQLGTGIGNVKKEIIENGYGFENPVTRQLEASYQYLSGNIREKLRQAEENNENREFDRNIKALQEVMPMEIPAHLIDFTLGSSWIDPKLYEDFVKERTEVDVRFTAVGGTWFMKEPYFTNYEKNRAMGVTSEMLGRTIMGHTLIEAAIQNRSITISTTKKHYDGTTETITDKEATQACAAKIDEIRQDFKDWARQKMQSDPEMSALIERIYNDMFNNFVPMSIPDEFVPEYFGGASHKFKMRPHQGKAIVRGTQQPLLLAHEVGTGKTFTLISTAMEMRRLGTARKPMIVVQNATVGQFVASAKELYPNAKILTLEEADRSAEGRKNFYAKIRYNDWDMIVVPQSTFEFIPDSEEREMAFVQDKIEEKMLILEKMKEEDPDGKNMITRQAEREIALLEEQLAGLADNASKKRTANDEKKRAVALQNAEVKAMEMLDRRTDDVENFDDMGIDALLVDEAHEYKHLGFATVMQRGVKGVDPSYSKKSQGVFLKTQAVLEKNNGRNVIFATGTPISNTAAEIWTFMRYLMPADTMKEYGIYYFDDFVRNFGNIQQMLEFTTSGKFKENNRFAGYVNLPELVRIWSGVSDTVLTKEAGGVKDKIPGMEGGKAQDLYLPQTRALRSIMKFVKSELEHYEQMSGKEKKENSHIPLTMYGIAKAAAVDARLVQSDAEDDPNSKTNEAVRQTLRSLKETADYKGTVAIFADNYQNKQSGFNLYDDIRNKLIAEGVPADEIVVMRSGMTVKKKLEIFEKVNRGEIRMILGSTFTLGTGVNIQERLHTLIHLDAPNRPMDYTQRNGRILRQGNLHKDMNKPVRILRFGVEDSLDVTAYQRLKTKGAIADSIMNGKQMMNNSMTNRVLEEEEDVFGDTVAQLSGSEYAMLKNNAEKNVRKYASRKKQWETDQTYIHNAKPRLKAFIKDAEKRIEDNGRYLEAVRSSFPDGQFKEIVIGKHRFTSVDTMDDFFKEHNKSVLAEMKQMKDGEIAGEQKRELSIQIGDFSFVVTTKLTRQTMRDGATLFNDVERKMTYSCPELGIENVPVRQNLLRNAIEDITSNVITGKDFAERLEAAERSKKHNEAELKELLSREGKPFEYEEELAQAKSQLEEYAELMKKELEEKEAKYAEMDATVETANNVSVSEEDDELKREGDGAYTDDEVSFENDPVAKLLGRPRRTAKQRREFAQRERQRMAERVERLAEKLHLDNVEVVTDASVLEGKKQRAKGFYSKSTGKITIVIPNHTSTFDVEQTLLHEAVAHYGLRQLFGEHFDTFLDNVFNNADENIRRRIVDMAAKNGWDFHKATEEYLASLAEDTEFENINASWWRQIKDFFLNMLHKIGFEDFRGVTLSDNELRYILWRSYENLAEPGRYRSILGEASDVAKQYELKVGNYAVADPHRQTVAENDDALYRDGDPERHERELARDRYERRVKSGMFQSQEALQDSMLGLKEAMTAILGKRTNVEDVDGFENPYLGENRLSSVNKAEADAFAHTLFKPMLDEVAKLARTEAEREELTDYMMAKHGLERNTYMRNEAINNGATDADQTDYAGLTALTGMDNVADAEAEAQMIIDGYEQAHDTADLWEKVNAVSKAILSKSYECGMMSKATFDKISGMYDFYIPLRGFDEKTSSEAYAYLTHKQSAFNAPIKKAEGRRSKADDPFANLQSMVEGAIMQGNRNKLVKQRFLNFALNHPSDLVSVSDIWVEYDAVTDEWKPVFPDNIDSTDTPEEVEQKMQDFETKMEQLAQQYPDQYKHGKDTVNIPYRIVESRDMRQHQIVVKRGGRDYVITINGNPRAAQALNGQTNPDNDMSGAIGAILRAGENINRQLSAFYTTRNPDFIVSNFMRDMLYTNTMTWIRESPNYALHFHRNYMYANPVRIKQLLAKHRKGTLDMGNKTEAMFHQFMMNGGETGYANIRDIEQHKNDIRRELKKSNGKIPVKKAWDLLGERFDEYNRAVENCARFAAFMTSREMGRSIDRAIYDAKEISVNFNKKGSGAKFYDSTGQTKTGNASALVSGLGRSGYVFWNAAIQGTANFGRQMKRHPAKAFTGIAAMFLLGAIVAYLGGDDDDDDDKNAYYNLPEYVRRSNILFRAGDSWVSIPLPVEYRAVYGMGELMISVLNGKEHLTGGEIAESIAGQATQILPIDFLDGGGGLNAFVPSAYKPLWEAYVAEKSWTGMPLYKDTPWNKDMPEWTKAYKSANKYIVGLANVMNEATGGDPYTKGAIDLNPAKIEYMLNGYFGGVFGTIDKLSKTAETVSGNREYDPRSFLLVNRLVKAGDERTEYRAVNNEYFRLKEEHDRLKSRLKHYEEDTDNDIFDYAEKIDFLYNSPEYERYEIFEDYHEDIDDLYNELKEAISDEERKDIEAELNEVKKEMIDEINLTRKRK